MNRKERRRLNKLSRQSRANGDGGADRERLAQAANELLEQGFTCLGAGLFQDAQRLGMQVLAFEPENPQAMNLCGIASFQLGDSHHGIELMQAAVEFKPDYAEGFNNLGNMLKAVGRTGEAETAYSRSLQINPQYFDAHYNHAILLELLGRLDEAEACFRRAADINPDFAEVYFSLGNVLKAEGKPEQAAVQYRRSIEMIPDHADALNNLGSVLHELGEFGEAIENYRRAIEIVPTHAPAHYNLGISLQELEKFDEAIVAYQRALEHKPDYVEAQINLGYAEQRSGDLDAAIAAYHRAIEIEPHNAQVHVNLGDALLAQGDAHSAVRVCDAYLESHPGNTGVLAFKAVALHELGDPGARQILLNFEHLIRRIQITLPLGFASHEDFNTTLADYVSNHPTLVSAPTSHATRHGQHSGELLSESKGVIAKFEAAIREAVEEYRQSLSCFPGHPLLANPPRRFALTAWGVVMQSRGHQIAHNHPSAWLSGVYYVELPDVVAGTDPSHQGWIEFGRPPEHFHFKATPRVELIQPVQGAILLFPAYFYHRTIPFESRQRRISIAFDVLALPED